MSAPVQPDAPHADVSTAALSDVEIVARVQAGDRGLFEILMRRHNQRLYRAARAIVRDESEVEDVMQQAYLNAFCHLDQFEARAEFSTWLTRIAINEAFARRRRRERTLVSSALEDPGGATGTAQDAAAPQPSPEHQAYANELHDLIEDAVDALPEIYRVVFMLRDVEGLTTSQTGEGLGLGDEAVKTRLHRARAMMRRAVTARIGTVARGTFQFQAPRCDRVVAGVLALIAGHPGATSPASDPAREAGL
jgi:RNA polymerase sigma-70 factor, ECF subfamily